MIFLLTRTDPIGYDEVDSKIVRATSETEARAIANKKTGDEGGVWGADFVTCRVVEPDGPSGEILQSYNAG